MVNHGCILEALKLNFHFITMMSLSYLVQIPILLAVINVCSIVSETVLKCTEYTCKESNIWESLPSSKKALGVGISSVS